MKYMVRPTFDYGLDSYGVNGILDAIISVLKCLYMHVDYNISNAVAL